MIKSKNIKILAIMLLLVVAICSFSLVVNRTYTFASSAAADHKAEVTNDGVYLLASSDTATNLVTSNINNVNTLPLPTSDQRTAADIYSSEVSGSANTTVWTMNFHSALATRIMKSIQFTSPIELSSIESITIRLNAHFSPTEGVYFTDMGGVMFCKLSETNCRKTNYSHTISRSVTQDEWIDYRISGDELSKLAETDGTIKGIQIAADMRGSTSANFYVGTPSQKQSALYIDYVYYTPKKLNAIDSMRENGFLLASANSGDYEFVDKNLKTFGGYVTVPGTAGKGSPTISTVSGKTTNDDGDTGMDWNSFTDGLIGTQAFRVPFHSDNTSLFSPAIKFTQKVKASEIGGITIRMYARLSSTDTYQTTYGGIQLFGLQSEGYTSGYMIPENVEQNKWIELVLLPEQAALLADTDGYISGLQIGAAFHSTKSDFLYQGTPTQGRTQCTARIWIEYVSVAKSVDVVYKSDGNEIKSSSGFIGTAIEDAFVPEKSGHVFCGWYNQKGELYDFSGVIDGETVLDAKWETEKDASEVKGLYYTAGQGKYGKTNTYLYIDDNGEIDFSDIDEIVPIAYGVTSSDAVYVINSNFSVKEFKLGTTYTKVDDSDVAQVIFKYEIGTKAIRVKKGEQLKNYSVERPGYILSKWIDEEGNTIDFNSLNVAGNLEFNAVWEYDQVSETLYKFYFGDYYCKESRVMLTLKAENKASLSGETVKYGEFYILKPGVIVLIFDGVKTENTVFAQRIVTTDNVTYVRLGEYIITFDTMGGSKIDDVVVSDGDHKVIKPEDPTKEGYVFKGWTTSDGVEYEFDQIVMGSTTLYAVWEPESLDQEPSGMKGWVLGLIIGGGTLVVSSATVGAIVLIKKKKKKAINNNLVEATNNKGE